MDPPIIPHYAQLVGSGSILIVGTGSSSLDQIKKRRSPLWRYFVHLVADTGGSILDMLERRRTLM